MSAVTRGFKAATRRDPLGPLLFVADRLLRDDHLEPRWFAFGLLERTLATETEQTWQLLRRAAREAEDWITVDDLAHPYARGIQDEPYRWAELELLVYSPSTLGTPPGRLDHRHDDPRCPRQTPRTDDRGDRPADPRRSSSATPSRTSRRRSPGRIARSPASTATPRPPRSGPRPSVAVPTDDGHRAWVIRDALVQARPGGRRRAARPDSPASAAGPAPRPPPPPPPRPLASARCPTHVPTPSPRSVDQE